MGNLEVIEQNRAYTYGLLIKAGIPEKELDDVYQDVCVQAVHSYDWLQNDNSDFEKPILGYLSMITQKVLSHRAYYFNTKKRTGTNLSLEAESEGQPSYLDSLYEEQEEKFPVEELYKALHEEGLLTPELELQYQGVTVSQQAKAEGVSHSAIQGRIQRHLKRHEKKIQEIKERYFE